MNVPSTYVSSASLHLDFLVGTDTASIGVWDVKWSDPVIREKSISAFLKRLPQDARERRLFYLETGGDGESSVRLHLAKPFEPDSRYRLVDDRFHFETDSGWCVLDGLEGYGSEANVHQKFAIPPGTYRVTVYELKDPEQENSRVLGLEGPRPPLTLLERMSFLTLPLLLVSLILFWKKQFLFGGLCLLPPVVVSHFLSRQKAQRKRDPSPPHKFEIETPALHLVLQPTTIPDAPGGWAKLGES
ncbi:MAG: hypothetical protein IPK50_14505 [Fibrobacterota bacterium]|nr:hypothetical protein [Fibrobacterota bacterium]QQS03508.1 MAG: hypothetical protein IPK50_14505 [Fibrobacterota bacterium]